MPTKAKALSKGAAPNVPIPSADGQLPERRGRPHAAIVHSESRPRVDVQRGVGREASSRQASGPERVQEIQRARLLAAVVQLAGELGAGNVNVAHVVERA